MVALTDNEILVLDLIRNIPADRRRLLLYELSKASEAAWQRNTAYAQEQLEQLAAAKGLSWQTMDDEHRQDFVAELLREDD